jgi:hypothetical protein
MERTLSPPPKSMPRPRNGQRDRDHSICERRKIRSTKSTVFGRSLPALAMSRFILAIDVGERLPVRVAHDEVSVDLLGGPGRREAAGRHGNWNDAVCHRKRTAARFIFQFGRIVESSSSDTRVGSKCSPLRRLYSMSRLRSLLHERTRSSAPWE